MVQLDFVLKLSEYNHCEVSETIFEIKNDLGVTLFYHELTTNDFGDAHTEVGHLFTVSLDAEVDTNFDASIIYSDTRAEEPAFASI